LLKVQFDSLAPIGAGPACRAISLCYLAAWGGILVVFRSLIPSDLYPLLWAAIALFVANACFTTLTDVLRGQEKSRWYTVIWISHHYGGVIFGLILVLVFKVGIGGLIWGQTLALLLLIMPLVWLTTRSVAIRPAHFNRSDFRQIWTFAWPFTIGNIAFWTLSLSDRYIVELFRGSYEVGPPIICRLWEERGRQAAEEALTIFTRMFFLMVIPAVFGLAVVAAPLVRLLADEAYLSGYRAIWLVACASMALGLIELGRIGCMVANRTHLIARNQCVAAGANLILTFILVPALGFMGAALSAALSFALLAGLQAITSARFLPWRWPLTSLWRVLTASAAMAASVLLLQAGLRSDTTVWQAVSLLLSIMVGALIYGSVLWGLGEISPGQLLDLFWADRRRAATNPATGETGRK
jgi:O-antigen/teichoic acid export membrane protein